MPYGLVSSPLLLSFINIVFMLEKLVIAYLANILIYSIPAQPTHKGFGWTYPEQCLSIHLIIRRLQVRRELSERTWPCWWRDVEEGCYALSLLSVMTLTNYGCQ